MGLNKVMLIGNAGRDAELRYTAGGTAVSDFSLAVNRKWRNQGGEMQEETEWANIVLFGKTAENLSQYITKGKQVYVEGRLQTRSWDDQETGQKKYRTEVIAQEIQLLGNRGDGGGGGGQRADGEQWGGRTAPSNAPQQGGPPQGGGYSGQQGGPPPADDPFGTDDLPFE